MAAEFHRFLSYSDTTSDSFLLGRKFVYAIATKSTNSPSRIDQSLTHTHTQKTHQKTKFNMYTIDIFHLAKRNFVNRKSGRKWKRTLLTVHVNLDGCFQRISSRVVDCLARQLHIQILAPERTDGDLALHALAARHLVCVAVDEHIVLVPLQRRYWFACQTK